MSDFGRPYINGRHGYNAVVNALKNEHIFDYAWIERQWMTGDPTEEWELYHRFVEDLYGFLCTRDVEFYPGVVLELAPYMEAYLSYRREFYDALTERVHDMLQRAEEWLMSEEYFRDRFEFSQGATDNEFYAQEIDYYAERFWSDAPPDGRHGFGSLDELKHAMRELAYYDGEIHDVAAYCGGSYGSVPDYDAYEGYIPCGTCFGGNNEEEDELPDMPFDKEHDYNGVYRDFCVSGGCTYIYAVNLTVCVYALRWDDLERKRDELREEKEAV